MSGKFFYNGGTQRGIAAWHGTIKYMIIRAILFWSGNSYDKIEAKIFAEQFVWKFWSCFVVKSEQNDIYWVAGGSLSENIGEICIWFASDTKIFPYTIFCDPN